MTADDLDVVMGWLKPTDEDDQTPFDEEETPFENPLIVAQWAVARGWYVHPLDHPGLPHCAGLRTLNHDPLTCTERGKHPCTKWSRESTVDPAVYSAWWIGQDRNIGIDCGKSNLLVVDEDLVGELARYAATVGQVIPPTVIVTTGRGRHYYFRQPPGIKLGSGKGALKQYKIDVRGYGGYVVGPSSVHATGVVYTPLDPDVAVAPCPQWLIDAVRGGAPEQNALDQATRWLMGSDNRPGSPIPDGSRHTELVAYAGHLRAKGMDADEAEILFERRWQDCAQPPDATHSLTWPEALGTLKDVYSRYQPGYSAAPSQSEQDSSTPPDQVQQAGDAQAVPVALLAALHTGTWLDQQTFPPLAYVVPGLIPEGMTLLVGPPKAGKSWAALDIALAVASPGGMAFGSIRVGDEPRPVLLLALEDGDRRLQDRCRALLRGQPIPSHWQYLTCLAKPGVILETIREWLEANPRGIVILDTLGKVMPPSMPGESAYGRDYRIGSLLKRTVDEHPGSGLLVLHHDRKAGADDFIDSVSGTHGLAGSADTILLLTRARQQTGGILHVTGRDIPEGEYAVDLTAGRSWQLSGGTLSTAATEAATRRATANLGDLATRIVGCVAGHPDQGVTAPEVAKALSIDVATARTYLKRLVDSGRIDKLDRGIYIPVKAAHTERGDEQ